jgi:hypothetical protein
MRWIENRDLSREQLIGVLTSALLGALRGADRSAASA